MNRLDELADLLRRAVISERWREIAIVDWAEVTPSRQEDWRRGVRALTAEILAGESWHTYGAPEMVTESIVEDEEPQEEVSFVVLGGGGPEPWEGLDLKCPDCGEDLPMEDLTTVGSLTLRGIRHHGKSWLRGPLA
jgi:hypothetical protein